MGNSELVEEGKKIITTPKLGIIKGIIIILFGLFLGSLYFQYGNIATTIWGWIYFGLCLWRGIVAIKDRKVKHVSYLGLGVWVSIMLVMWYLSGLAALYRN